MSILGAIANPQMADIAGALDARQARLDRDEARRKEIRAGQLIAEALPNIKEGTPLYEMARDNPKMFMLFSKSIGIPLNAGEQMQEFTDDVSQLYTLAQSDPSAALEYAHNIKEQRNKSGRDTPQIDKWLQAMAHDPAAGMTGLFTMHRALNANRNNMPAGLQEFEGMTEGLSESDKDRARRIALGLDARAVGSSAITTATTGLTDTVAQSEAAIAGAKAGASEGAKLDEQLNKLPQVKAAVASAEQQVRELGDRRTKAASDGIALNMYETAMSGLIKSLEGTSTGYIAGRLPAVTPSQQIAEGGVSAMAPILKSLFRTAGEGTFTDKDQELLMNMVPTRKDTKEAIAAKVNNINAIVAAKLSAANQSGQTKDSPAERPAATSRYKIEVLD